MLSFITNSLLILAIALTVNAGEVKKEENVWVLNKDNFQEVIQSNQFVLVEFCKCILVVKH